MELIGTFPTTNNPEETFNIILLTEIFSIRQLWNTLGFWTLSITDKDGILLVAGVKIVSGIFLLDQYPSVPWNLKIDSNADPTRFDLETTVIEVYSK